MLVYIKIPNLSVDLLHMFPEVTQNDTLQKKSASMRLAFVE
jgi:hypothetical protein